MLLPEIMLALLRAKVYLYLVDGKNGGLSPKDVAIHLAVSQSVIAYHVKWLESNGYIKRLDGKHNPQKYTKTSKSSLLDSVISKLNIQIDGGTVNPPSNSNPRTSKPSTPLTEVPTDRAHINGRITFPVIKVGSFKSLPVRENGSSHEMSLFSEPYKDNHNVKRWLCKVPYDGKEVTIEFSENLANAELLLHVWPKPRKLVAEQVPMAAQLLMSSAQDIVNFLAKHGGWQFGICQMNGELHHGLSDTPWAKEIPETDRNIRMGNMWIDHSPGNDGKQEPETSNERKALIAMTLPDRMDRLEGGEQTVIKEIVEFRLTVEELRAFLHSLVNLERERAEYETLRATRESLSAIKRSESTAAHANGNGAQDSDSSQQPKLEDPADKKYGVMYR